MTQTMTPRYFLILLQAVYILFTSIILFSITPKKTFGVDKVVKIDFSANLKVKIIKIEMTGAKTITLDFLDKHFDIEENKEYWLWDLKEKVENLRKSGYIASKTYKYYIKKVKGKDSYNLLLHFKENPTIGQIKIINHTRVDPSLLMDFLEEYHFGVGKIASKKNFDRAIHDFLKYYQKKGLFLIEIFDALYESPDLNGLKLVLTIEPIKSMTIDFIKVEGSKHVSYRLILKNIDFHFHDTITSNDVLDRSYIKIKQLGLFSSVFFRFKNLNPPNADQEDKKEKKNGNRKGNYDVVIHVEEVDMSAIVTSTQFSPELGPIFLAQYVNLNIGGGRDRILLQAGYEGDLKSVIFIGEYTKPDLLDRIFLSVQIQKKDRILSINSTTNKLSEIYSLRLTGGYQFFDFFSGFLTFKEKLTDESAIDLDGNKTTTPTGVTLKDNVLQSQIGILFLYNSLNDTFNPDRGIRSIISYDIIPEASFTHSLLGQSDFYFSLSRSIILGFFLQGNYMISKDNTNTLYEYPNRRTDAQTTELDLVRATLFASFELRFSTRKILDDSYFVTFFEAGGLWPSFDAISTDEIGLGVGIGLRWAPSKYHHSFLFGFPGSINIGIKLSKKDYKSPNFSLLQHRDQFFYLNLTGGF